MKQQSILVIDQQAYWRELAATALSAAGYSVVPAATYDEALQHQQDFALVLLGCVSIEVEERLFLARLLARKYHIIVLATYLSAHAMRALFLRRVEDVGDKTYDPADLIDIVKLALERIGARRRSSYPLERETCHD